MKTLFLSVSILFLILKATKTTQTNSLFDDIDKKSHRLNKSNNLFKNHRRLEQTEDENDQEADVSDAKKEAKQKVSDDKTTENDVKKDVIKIRDSGLTDKFYEVDANVLEGPDKDARTKEIFESLRSASGMEFALNKYIMNSGIDY